MSALLKMEISEATAFELPAMPIVAEAATVMKTVVLIVAAPFIGLAFIIAMPLLGIPALGYHAVKAALKH